MKDSRHVRPFSKRSCLSFESKKSTVSPVPPLFFVCRPLAICFRVMAVDIDPIYRRIFLAKFFTVLKIAIVHIVSKFLEGFPEALNTTAAIIFKGSIFRISTCIAKAIVNVFKF
jgi:hypothetical protein